MRRHASSLLLLAAFLVAPLAAAQAPVPTPSYSLAFDAPPAEFPAIPVNGSGSVSVRVVLSISGVVCAEPVTIPVTITVTAPGAPAGATFVAEPAVANVTIGQGPQGLGGAPGGGAADVVVRASVAAIPANVSIPVEIGATAPAPPGPPTGCQGAGQLGSATAAPVTVFANLTAPPPPPVEELPPEDKSLLPGPGALMGVLAAVGAAVALRRPKA